MSAGPAARSTGRPVGRRPVLTKGGGAAPAWSPASLFAAGEKGWAILPGTSFGASYVERTSPVTVCGNGDPCGTYHDGITGLDFRPSADARRPLYTVASGKTYLDWDGTDDCLFSAAIDFTGTDKITLIEAVEVDVDATQVLTELSAQVSSNDGSFYLVSKESGAGDISWAVKGVGGGGTPVRIRRTAGASLPRRAVTSCVYNIGAAAAGEVSPRINGAVPSTTDVGDAGTGNFGNYVPYVGARNNASLRFNGRKWASICVGRALTAQEILDVEAYVTGLVPA